MRSLLVRYLNHYRICGACSLVSIVQIFKMEIYIPRSEAMHVCVCVYAKLRVYNYMFM